MSVEGSFVTNAGSIVVFQVSGTGEEEKYQYVVGLMMSFTMQSKKWV